MKHDDSRRDINDDDNNNEESCLLRVSIAIDMRKYIIIISLGWQAAHIDCNRYAQVNNNNMRGSVFRIRVISDLSSYVQTDIIRI